MLFDTDRDRLVAAVRAGKDVPAFELAGPRQGIFFDPARVKAAIVTCGGLCPGHQQRDPHARLRAALRLLAYAP